MNQMYIEEEPRSPSEDTGLTQLTTANSTTMLRALPNETASCLLSRE